MPRTHLRADVRDATDEEILAALIGPVTPDGLSRARALLDRVGGYSALSHACLRDLVVAEGVGPARAYRVLAAVEAGRRALSRPLERGEALTSPRQVHEAFAPQMADLEQEQFVVLLLDRKQRVIRQVDVSLGTLDSSLVHPREVFREAIREAAASVLGLHNHPSGDPTPSSEDLALTRRLTAAAEVLGLQMLDHVIICRDAYHSFQEHGDL